MFLIHQVREVNKYQWKKANSALCRYLSLTIPVAGCRRLSWLKNQFRRHSATDIWIKGKFSLALMGNGNHYVHGSLSELCNYQIYYKFDNYTITLNFSLVYFWYCIVCMNMQAAHYMLWNCVLWRKASFSHFHMPYSVHQDNRKKEIYKIIFEAFHWALFHSDSAFRSCNESYWFR